MYRVLSVLVVAFLVVGMPARAQIGETSAQDRSGLMVQARAGLTVPRVTSQFRNFYSVGRGVGAGVGYGLTPTIDVFVRGHYSEFLLDEGGVDGIIPEIESRVDGANGTIVSGTVDLRFRTGPYERMEFYLLGGVGAYHQSIYEAELTNEADETNTFTFGRQEQTSFGLNFGVELATPVADRIEVSLAPTFVLILGEPVDGTRPREQTGRVGFFSVDLGVSWGP